MSGSKLITPAIALVVLAGAFIYAQGAKKEARALTEESVALQKESDKLKEQNQVLAQTVAKLRKDIEQSEGEKAELIRLRGEVAVLKRQAQTATMSAAQTQASAAAAQEKFANFKAEMEQKEEQAQAMARQEACLSNLRLLAKAKETWAADNQRPSNAIPTDIDLFGPNRYMGSKPKCPEGGIYSLGPVSLLPSCSHEGHAL